MERLIGRWIVFYEGGGTYSHLDGPAEDSPAWGVVAIAQESETTGHRILAGQRAVYFIHVCGEWRAVDDAGLLDQLTHYGNTLRAFRVGRWVPDSEYEAILGRAVDSDAVPPRSARSPHERVVLNA